MSWKDFLQIPKHDKSSILILLLVILSAISLQQLTQINVSKSVEKTTTKDISEFKETIDSTYIAKYQTPIKAKVGELVNINKADSISLQRIPGIGKTLALRIIQYRNENGSFTSLDQIQKVKGLKGKKYAKIKPYLKLND